MLHRRQVTASLCNTIVACLMLLLGISSSCVAPKKNQYPSRKPFVFKTTIKLDAKIPNDQKIDLVAKLQDQLDDSLRVRTVTSAKWLPPFIYKKLVTPPVYDSLNVSRSIVFMNGLLVSLGYSTPSITDTVWIDSVKKDQYRTNISFIVRPGKRLTFDSIAYDLQTPALQALAIKSASQSWLKKGNPYTKQILSTEISRLVDTFRNNGYYKFSKEDLYMEQDTVIAGLIDPTLDPFQQADLLEQLKKKREFPTMNIVVKQRNVRDSSHLTKYYIGKVTAFPDLPITEDSTYNNKQDTTTIRNITLITRSNKFQLPFVANNIFLRPGRLYKQENYYRTFNRFNQLSAWQYINIDFDDSNVADSLVDVTLRMYPAKKQNVNVALEAARNTNDIVTATNLFGIGVNLGLQNRNAYKQSVRTTTNLRGGVELGKDFIQTVQASISHSIFLPKLIVPFNINREGRLKNAQTILNVNASYIDRRDFYSLKTINGSWGYQWTKSNKTFTYKPINVEYSILGETDSLKKILATNPALRLAFRTGLVVGQQFAYSSLHVKNNKSNRFRFSLEESGALLGLIRDLDKGELLRFVKGDVEYVHNIDYGKTQLVMRGYAGMGFAYGRQGEGYEKTLPFYKAYFAGGPNSMRAWQVRQLGLGSSKFYNDTPYVGLDRFGDIQLEGNVEYRFPLGTVFGYKLKGALFTDVGNIWNWSPIDTSAPAKGSDFNLGRFYKELAVGAGIGLRIDFTYFLIRLDWAYKIKDPQRKEYSDKWFYGLSLGSGQFQLGINYPF
jgi:outer membrane protein insertion porin family